MARWSVLALLLVSCGSDDVITFELRVTNVASPDGIEGPSGRYTPVFSPGWVRAGGEPIFAESSPASEALELLAESANPIGLINTEGVPVPASYADDYEANLLLPGASMQTTFVAGRGDRLSFVSMLGVSNDAFIGGDVELFDDLGPREGDITEFVRFYDAGTERNEELGFGSNQPRSGPGGEDEGGVVQVVGATGPDGHAFPDIASVVRVELVVIE